MARKVKNIHYIYKTTCNITGKWYVGMHSTSNENDGYMGSGKILRYSIRKHGKENHTKEILEYCDTRELLVLREIEIVTLELIGDGLCMNLKEGGDGGWFVDIHNKAFKEKLLNDSEFRDKFSEQRRLVALGNIKSGKTKPINEIYSWDGKNHTNETKKSISITKKNTGVGKTNSQFGSCWVTKNEVNKKIVKNEIDSYLTDGWTKGRFTNISGELVKNSKLKYDDVIKIKQLLGEKELTQSKIGKLFNVHQETISKINRKLIWN